MIILLHSSKTMRSPEVPAGLLQTPALLPKAKELAVYLQTLSPQQLAHSMRVSPALAQKTHELLAQWTADRKRQSLAIDSFVGDIYSGLQASKLSKAERDYANEHLRIFSGLYGMLRPYDGICPYRLEMGYKLPDEPFSNLYTFWGEDIAACLPAKGLIVNVAAVEFSRTVTPFVDHDRIVTPRFLTVDPKTGEPTFVVVHAKIARGAFARWLIASAATDTIDLAGFADIGYVYDADLSTPNEPAFVCQEFGGIGLSVRLQ